jgi:BioD-like phosphotransacetylase family protein
MNALYITSVEAYSGKTAVCLALGKQLQADGHQVGYLKPVSTQPWRTPEGVLADEDAAFVKANLDLAAEVSRLSPVIVTSTSLREHLHGGGRDDLLQTIRDAAREAAEGKQALLLEGGASLRQGYSIGLSNLRVADFLGAPALVIVKYRGEMELVDDALTAQFRLEDQLLGVILNQVGEQHMAFVEDYARPFLEKKGIRVLGVLPLQPRLAALSVKELVELMGAEILTNTYDPDRLVETFTVGAMTADKALSRFRRYQNKAVITGGDRTDIQLAALETSTSALILTGNLRPSPLIIQQADALGVVILLVQDNTMETVEVVESAYGKTRLGQPEKLDAFRSLMAENVDLEALYDSLGLG